LGPVFRAYDASRERLVAVKLFKLDLPPERAHALVAELQRIVDAKLDHPTLAVPLATGIVGVSAYLVQEYVAADSLDQTVREFGPAPPGDALRVAAQIGGALDFAGIAHIAHGALHPRDVLLSSDDTRLTGVGIAHALEQVGVVPPVRRPYTAPERVAGGSWDRRADIFSLASLLHELLWGRRPSGTGDGAAEALTDIVGGYLAALRAVFAVALAESPAERFETALEFAEALSAAFPDVTLARPSNPRRAKEHEPRLPLEAEPDDEPTEIVRTSEAARPDQPAYVDVPVAIVAASDVERYQDVEAAPASVDDSEQPPGAPIPKHAAPDSESAILQSAIPESEIPRSAINPQTGLREPQAVLGLSKDVIRGPQFETALERSRSAVWPLVLALGLGVAVGFAGGYGIGTHGRPDTGTAPAAALSSPSPVSTAAAESKTAEPATATPTAGAKEFTETAVAGAPKSATVRSPADSRSVRNQSAIRPSTISGRPEPVEGRNPQTAIDAGRLLVRSTPAGARVLVDGREYGLTPAVVRDLARGTHHVRLVRDGYAPIERRVVITADRPSQSMTIPLERAVAAQASPSAAGAPAPADAGSFVGTLVVMSRPNGARVFVDGKLAGTTPLSLNDVRAGEHAVRIERDGYRRWSSAVRIVAAEQNRVTASLER
jgi:serine/threonine-protein kinase